MFEGIDAVGEGIDLGEMPECGRHGCYRVHGAGQKQHGHDQEIHDDVEAVKGGEPGGDQNAERRDAERYQQGNGDYLEKL